MNPVEDEETHKLLKEIKELLRSIKEDTDIIRRTPQDYAVIDSAVVDSHG